MKVIYDIVCMLFFGCFVPFDDCMLMFSFITWSTMADQLSEPSGSSDSPPFHCSRSIVFHINMFITHKV